VTKKFKVGDRVYHSAGGRYENLKDLENEEEVCYGVVSKIRPTKSSNLSDSLVIQFDKYGEFTYSSDTINHVSNQKINEELVNIQSQMIVLLNDRDVVKDRLVEIERKIELLTELEAVIVRTDELKMALR